MKANVAAVMGWGKTEQPKPAVVVPATNTRSFNIESFIREHLKVLRGPVAWNGIGRKWELESCPFNAEHTNGCAVITEAADGTLGFKCHHNSCVARHWKDVRALFDGPRPSATNGNSRAGESSIVSVPEIVSAADLYAGEIAQLRPLISGLMWAGLLMLIAKAKAGKSWLMLQIAIAVAGGPPVNGMTVLENGPVLYVALEEPAARTMARLRKLAQPGEWTKNLHFVYGDLLPLMGGGAEQLTALIEKLQPRLMVLDTLTALIKGGGKRESDVFRSQYAEVSRIRKLAEDFHTAIAVVHHVRKGVSDGPVEAVAGTGGIAAAVDTLWHLRRKPEGEATLEVVGRETEEKTLALQFGNEPFGWAVLGDDAAQLLNAERREVLELLREEGALSPAAIAAELGKSRPAVRQMLKRMRTDDQVQKQGTKYIPSLSMSHRVTERERE